MKIGAMTTVKRWKPVGIDAHLINRHVGVPETVETSKKYQEMMELWATKGCGVWSGDCMP